jgi:uncharacterized small protein (DUF1192 family)
MSNPVIHAFFLGRALAEVLTEKIEDTCTNALSELGKFDAEQREKLRQLIEEVQARADKEAAQGTANPDGVTTAEGEDLQEMIDELRAEIARLKAELKNYRDQNS